MAIAISDAHRELGAVARSFLENNKARAASRALLDAPDEALPPFWDELAQLGWLGLHIPEEFGGSGYGVSELVVVLEELGRVAAPGPFLGTVMASTLIDRAGDDDQRAHFLPSLVDGSQAGAVGLGGSLQLDTDGNLVGDAGLVLGAGLADVLVLRAGDDMVIVESSAAGVETSVQPGLDPTRRVGRVTVTGTPVDAVAVLRGAFAIAQQVAWTLAAAEASGGAQECVETASAYAKDRLQFGRPIAMFQAVKHHCANMLVGAELATAAVWDAGRAASGDPAHFELAAATAATLALPAFYRNAQLNIQVHGGIGFTWEHDGHLLLRRATALAALFDANAAADTVTRCSLAGVTRDHGFELPPEAEEYREATRAAAAEIAALDGDAQLARFIDTGYVQPHWPKPWGRAAPALEQLVIEEEFARAGLRRQDYGITGWIILTLIQHATEDQVARWVRPTLERKYHVVPALQRARRRLRRGGHPDARDPRRRWLGDHRPEGVDERCPALPTRARHRAHQPRRAEARRHHHRGRRHAGRRRGGAPAARSHRRGDVQRGLLRPRVRARRRRRRRRSTTGGRSRVPRSATSG